MAGAGMGGRARAIDPAGRLCRRGRGAESARIALIRASAPASRSCKPGRFRGKKASFTPAPASVCRPIRRCPAAWRLECDQGAGRPPDRWRGKMISPEPSRSILRVWVMLVLVRQGPWPASYHLAVTLDDAADGVTLVTRGGRSVCRVLTSIARFRRCSALPFRAGTIMRC